MDKFTNKSIEVKEENIDDDDIDNYHDEAELIDLPDGESVEVPVNVKGKNHRCETCLKTFRTMKELKIHIRVHTNERPYKCTECEKAFKQQSALTDHVNTHTGLKKHNCQVCGGKFSTSSSLKRHIKRIHGNEKTFSCSLCNKRFLNKTAYTEHKEVHFSTILHSTSQEVLSQADSDGFKCTKCNKSFKRKPTLFKHLDIHSETRYDCEYCSRSFTHLALKSHIKRHHSGQVCLVCDQTFYDRRTFLTHEKRHFWVATDTCDYCGDTFDTSEKLQHHMLENHCSKDSLHNCLVCIKSYGCLEHLQKHVDFAHVKCNLCKKYFRFYDEMELHFTNTHNAFKCSRCKVIFKSKSHLAFHLNTAHLVITKFTCKICGHQFQRYKHLRIHQEIHALKEESNVEDINVDRLKVEGSTSGANKNKKIVKSKIELSEQHFTMLNKKRPMLFQKVVSGSNKSHQDKITKLGVAKLLPIRKCNTPVSRSIRCQYCPKMFYHYSNFYRHNLQHHGKYPCTICFKVLFSVRELDAHKAMHITQTKDTATCYICNVTLSSNSGLKRHVRRVHMKVSNENSMYSCQYCAVVLKKRSSLLWHQYRLHLDLIPEEIRDRYADKVITCEICGKIFHRRDHLEKHTRVHYDKAPYLCVYCKTSFRARSGLITHMKIIHNSKLIPEEGAS